MLSYDNRVSVRSGVAKSLVKGDGFLQEVFPDLFVEIERETKLPETKRTELLRTPFIDSSYVDDLQKMLDLYAALHVLENSMRRLIERTLAAKLGDQWWEAAASEPQKRKHRERLDKESTKKWLPARSGLGPLYSLDWGDLISIMRKYERYFTPLIGDVGFLHRYADLGMLRHVVAHHGFIDNPRDFERVSLYLHDWQLQVGKTLAAS